VRLINGARADDLVLGQRLITRQRLVIPLWQSVLLAAGKAALRSVVWAARCWSLTLPPVLLTAAWWRYGPVPVGLTLGTVTAFTVTWWLIHPASIQWLGRPAWSRLLGNWRLTMKYRRLWRAGMLGANLVVDRAGVDHMPILRRVVSTWWTDTVTVRLLHGQTPEQFTRAAEQLRHTFSAHRCVVRETRPGWVQLRFYSRDPLVRTVHAFPLAAAGGAADLARLPVAITEDGLMFYLRLLGVHLLIAGASGSGKGSVLWSILRALVPLITGGQVQVWAIDPKGGMELVLGRPLFARYEDTNIEGMAVLLEDAVAGMDARTQRLKGVTRQHVPTPADPYVIILIDEVASLTAYCADKDVKRRIQTALSLLLSKGRAPGYSVIAALQDPRKDVLPFRDLFTTRIALRLSEPEQVDMVLGDSARERGARCHDIPLALPGVGYVIAEDHPAPIRARFSWVTDADITSMAGTLDPDRVADWLDTDTSTGDDSGRAA
jgi:DNA segregation ATPase FtsK/SpoIIIE, S-DNA-T family